MKLHSRREFLAGTSTLGLAAAATAMLPRMAWSEAMGLPPGIQLYTVRDQLPKDTPGTLKLLYQIGFREVETAGFGKYSVKEFRGLVDDAGLKVPSAHVDLAKEDLGPVFEDVHSLGAQFATSSSLWTSMVPRPPAGSPRPAGGMPRMTPLGTEGFTKLAAKMNEIGKKAKAAGLQYAYHNHNYEFEKMPDGSFGYDILINQTDHDLVKFEVDCGWMCAGGANPITYFQKYPGRFKMIHVKEFEDLGRPTTSLADRPQGTDLGKGFIDYKPIFVAGKKAGIEHAFSEQENPFPISQIESAKAAFAFLKASS